jgi:hypothetical protein
MTRAEIKQHWQQAKAEWKTNLRLQAITAAASVLVVAWVYIQLDHWRISKQKEASAALSAYWDTQAVVNEKAWLERAEQAGSAVKKARAQLWEATSEGEAEAKLRDWLNKVAAESGMVLDRITVEVGAAPQGQKWRPVHADFQGNYKAGAWQKMLQKIATNTPAVTVDFEQLNLANPRNQFYRVNVTAWYTITSEVRAP